MAKKFVQTYQVSFAKSLDISKDYKKKEKNTFSKIKSSFELEITPKDLFLVENYLVPVLLPHNLDSEIYEELFKETFNLLKDYEKEVKAKLTFWNDGHFTIQIKYPEEFRMIKGIKSLPGKKTSRKIKYLLKGRLVTFFFLKKYGYFGKRKNKLKRLTENFRKKFLRKRTLAKRDIFEIIQEKRKEAIINNISLSRAWGEVTKSFFFKKTFNSYLGWSKSKIFDFQKKIGEVV